MSDLLVLGHGHHNCLLSWGLAYKSRKREILDHKPKRERALRLRCMWQLTPEQIADLPSDVLEAGTENLAADLAIIEARKKAQQVEVRTAAAVDSFWEADVLQSVQMVGWLNYEGVLRSNRAALDAWHARHCPALRTTEGCPWNGARLVGVGD